jgi:hypothetical protein
MVEEMIQTVFPGLCDTSWSVTSPASESCNCIAWAAGDAANWWWPDPTDPRATWPAGVRWGQEVADFVSALATLGYEITEQKELEAGFERVALFVDTDSIVTHAARQLPSGTWTSKLGRAEDIEHGLHALEGTTYGRVVQILKRQVPGA